MPSFSPNLPVTAACKFQTLFIHICHPPCHQHLTHGSLGFQIWPGITLKQPSMIDSSCIYSIISQREEKTRRFAVATAKEFYVKHCGLWELFCLVQEPKFRSFLIQISHAALCNISGCCFFGDWVVCSFFLAEWHRLMWLVVGGTKRPKGYAESNSLLCFSSLP